jgi:hypothetical protein
MIEGGTMIAVTVGITLNANDGELALYIVNGDFGNSGNIVDYVEWGSTGHTRSSVAQAAGIWSGGDFVPSWTGCASLEYDGSGDSSGDWVSQDVPTSPCLTNSLDGCGGSNCSIAGAGLSSVTCNNNGTPSNPNDDFISFNLNPTGVDLATTYLVSVSAGSIMPTSATYGSPTAFQLQAGSAGNGNVTVTITDNDDPTCTFNVVVNDPGTCSNACAITGAGLSGIFCNDAGTPSEDSDDFIMFNLDPDGMNIGPSYTVSVSNGTVDPTGANFGGLTTFHLNDGSAGDGNVTVTITDINDSGCTAQIVITDPGTCSDDCGISNGGLADVACDDNGTGSVDADDFITFSLDPVGTNLSATYNLTVSTGSISPMSGTYGAPESYSLNTGSAGNGNVTVTITDSGDPACTRNVVITDPGACSESCNINSGGLTGVSCNNNGSNEDPADDFISFSLNPTGVNLGATYNVSVGAGAITPMVGTYGAPTAFSLNNGSAGGGNVSVMLVDGADPSCVFSLTVVDPGTCSNGCAINSSGLAMVACNDAGTSTDPVDDFIEFSLNPTGDNIGAGYTVTVSAGTIDPAGGSYGASTSFTLNGGSAGSGDVIITIADDTELTCILTDTIVDPGSCSDDCLLTNAGLSGVDCDSNNTLDETDDMIVFSLDPSGTGLSSGYTVAVAAGTVTPDNAPYGVATAFAMNPGSAGGGGVVVTITDIADTTCAISVTVADPGPCSEVPCEALAGGIATSSETSICVDDGVLDSIEVTIDPLGIGSNGSWVVTGPSGEIQSLQNILGDISVFTFEGQPSGTCLIWFIVWDGVLNGLSVGENLDSLSGCFGLSDSIPVTKLTGTDCISSASDPDLDALINVYPNPTSGTLFISSKNITVQQVRIIDLIGRTIMQTDQINPTEIDLQGMDRGLYYIVLETNRGQSLKKVVIGK